MMLPFRYLHRHRVFLFRHAFQVEIGAVGGIDLLLAAVQVHPNNHTLQENACLALRNLSIHANKVQNVFRIDVNYCSYDGMIFILVSLVFAAHVCTIQARLPRGSHSGPAQPPEAEAVATIGHKAHCISLRTQ